MAYDRLTVTMDVEKSIVTLLITSTEFCKQVLPSGKPDYFENEWSRTVFKWVAEHFEIYTKAPESDIQTIYMSKYESLSEEDASLIEAFLANLSSEADKYTSNLEFHIERALAYFKKRSLIVLADTMQTAIKNSNYDAAEKELMDFRTVSKGLSNWLKPSDFLSVLSKGIEREEDPLLMFPGDLGKFIGPLQRRWLVFWMGPPKRGKSNGLIATVIAAMAAGLRIAVFSHEMSDVDWLGRFFKTLTPGAAEAGNYPYPVIDCYKNASNQCSQRYRRGFGPCIINGAYNDRYLPCNVCEGKSKDYEPCICKKLTYVEAQTNEAIAKMAVATKRWMEDKIRLIHYPPYSASVLDMERDLDRMAYAENFYADVVIDDYIGAHAPGDKRLQGRDVYDFEAKHLKRIADARNLLLVSAFQGNRSSIRKHRISMQDTAEDIRIINHCDKVITLNQTEAESHNGIMRIGKAADRHMEWHSDDECTILQNLSHGIIVMNSKMGWIPTLDQKEHSGDDDSDE